MSALLTKMVGPDQRRDISLESLPQSARAAAVERALDKLSSLARERFPGSQGYALAEQDMLAGWAWPKGAQSEAEARKFAGPETVALARRRNVTVRRGMTRGITLDLATADRAQSKLVLNAHLETRLGMVLAMSGLAVCTVGAVALAFVAQGENWKVRPLVIAMLVGMLVGGVVALALIKLSKVIESAAGDPIKADEGRQHLEEIAAAVGAAARGG